MERFIMRDMLTEEQKKKFDAIDDVKLYEVIEDRQGGEFGMDRQYTLKEWIDQAFEWLYMDECFEEDQVFVNYLLNHPEDALNQIDDFWEITFEEVK